MWYTIIYQSKEIINLETKIEKKKTFIGGAAILGVAGIISKLLGAFFRIPLANIIGDDGMGYYQTAYPIYIALLMISSSGIPTAISRMIAERQAKGLYLESQKIFSISSKIMIGIGLVTGLGLMALARPICEYIHEPDAVYSMMSVAPALIFCPITSCLRGYFQGHKNMIPTAISQVVEQVFRVSIGFWLAMVLLKTDKAHAAAGATFGASVGGLFAFLYMLIIYLRNHRKENSIQNTPLNSAESLASTKDLAKEIAIIAIPITLGSMIMPIINFIDTMLVKTRLIDIGYSSDVARGMFGQLTGMASPIINMPDAITAAVAMSLVPIIADANKRGDHEFVKENSQLALRYAVLVGLPCVFGITVLAEPIMLLLYPLQKEAAISAAGCLTAYAGGIVFLAIHQALSGVLQGIGEQNTPAINLLVGAGVKIVATYVLCGIPSINVRGAAYGTVIAYCISAFLNFRAVRKKTGLRINISICIVRPLISSALMGGIAWLTYYLTSKVFGNAISTILAVGVGVLSYVILVFATGSISKEDLKGSKKLEKLAFLLDKVTPSGKIK